MSVPTNIDWKALMGRMTTFGLRRFKPTVHEAILSQIRGGNVKEINVNLNFGFIPGRANIALLRIAYLTMFRELGYRYILSPAASVIRDVISSYETCPAEIGKFVCEVRGEPERFSTPLQLLKIQGGIAIMVVMTLHTETRRYYAASRRVDAQPGTVTRIRAQDPMRCRKLHRSSAFTGAAM